MEQEKPYQWMIDELTDDIEFFKKHGMDKERPDLFERLQGSLEKAKARQEKAMKLNQEGR